MNLLRCCQLFAQGAASGQSVVVRGLAAGQPVGHRTAPSLWQRDCQSSIQVPSPQP